MGNQNFMAQEKATKHKLKLLKSLLSNGYPRIQKSTSRRDTQSLRKSQYSCHKIPLYLKPTSKVISIEKHR